MNRRMNTIGLIAVLLIMSACNNNPKVISATSENENSVKSSGIFTESSNTQSQLNTPNQAFGDDLHQVIVNEVLPASKYLYLNVKEADKQFWIATTKKEVNVGETYFYKGGLLKTNFESKEHDRVFDKIYLVTNLVPEKHGNNSGNVNINDYSKNDQNNNAKEDIPTHTEKIIQDKGSIKIAELVKDSKKYEGKTVQLSGICTKINAGIMNRNWIHLKDGSKDDYDLVITSQEFVPEGSNITIKALVTLNKDFGAGYSYELILENGELVK